MYYIGVLFNEIVKAAGGAQPFINHRIVSSTRLQFLCAAEHVTALSLPAPGGTHGHPSSPLVPREDITARQE